VISYKLSATWHRYALQIVLQARDLLRSVPSLVDVNVPDGCHFTVCGDVHGQVFALTTEEIL
jgi:serine/threonine-protein phosphatase 5